MIIIARYITLHFMNINTYRIIKFSSNTFSYKSNTNNVLYVHVSFAPLHISYKIVINNN